MATVCNLYYNEQLYIASMATSIQIIFNVTFPNDLVRISATLSSKFTISINSSILDILVNIIIMHFNMLRVIREITIPSAIDNVKVSPLKKVRSINMTTHISTLKSVWYDLNTETEGNYLPEIVLICKILDTLPE